jgi:mevalonate pyrophosphate decarboxylase
MSDFYFKWVKRITPMMDSIRRKLSPKDFEKLSQKIERHIKLKHTFNYVPRTHVLNLFKQAA